MAGVKNLLFSKSPPSYSTLLEKYESNETNETNETHETNDNSSNKTNHSGEKISLIHHNDNNNNNNYNFNAHEIKELKAGEGEFFGSSFNLASAAIGLGILSLRMLIK